MANPDSYVGMSDEEFEAQLNGTHSEESEEAPSEPLSLSDETLDETPADDAESPTAASEELSEVDEEETTEGETDEESEEDNESEESDETSEEEEPVTSDLDELYKPFKASGKEVQVTSVEEAKKLMSMGVDYANKLQGFKVHRKTIKTLEENKIDADKLNLLIDAANGNKGAISKLIQDHEIDTMELDSEGSNYTPSDYSVSDATVEMDDVIDRIQSTASFSTTSDIVTNRWDEASKKVIFENPVHLETLNEHVSNGTYERVMKEVDRARMFGGLQNLTDLQAYQQVGTQMQKDGVFNNAPAPAAVVSRKPKAKPVTNTDKKLRASPSKGTPNKQVAVKYDYANMPDEEFEKLLK